METLAAPIPSPCFIFTQLTFNVTLFCCSCLSLKYKLLEGRESVVFTAESSSGTLTPELSFSLAALLTCPDAVSQGSFSILPIPSAFRPPQHSPNLSVSPRKRARRAFLKLYHYHDGEETFHIFFLKLSYHP